jgi:hypothetical protein
MNPPKSSDKHIVEGELDGMNYILCEGCGLEKKFFKAEPVNVRTQAIEVFSKAHLVCGTQYRLGIKNLER